MWQDSLVIWQGQLCHVTHISDEVHHGATDPPVEALIWDGFVSKPPGAQDELSVRVEVNGTDDGGVSVEVVDDVSGLQLRLGVWSSIVFSFAVGFLASIQH